MMLLLGVRGGGNLNWLQPNRVLARANARFGSRPPF